MEHLKLKKTVLCRSHAVFGKIGVVQKGSDKNSQHWAKYEYSSYWSLV